MVEELTTDDQSAVCDVDQDVRIATYNMNRHKYPRMNVSAEPLSAPVAAILGRNPEDIRKSLRNPEKANIALLAEPGTGKTAYVQSFAFDEDSKQYFVLDVNPEKLIPRNGDKDTEMMSGFNELVLEVSQYSKDHNIIVVLFIDEFHKIAMMSPSLVESLKPILEKSARNGFRIIAATTFEEYNRWISSKNRALDQRFLRFTLPELDKESVIKILRGRAAEHKALEHLDESVLVEIYDESRRILLDNAQPRASIDILNDMIGEAVKTEYMEDGQLIREYATPQELHINSEKSISRPLLKRVVQRAHGLDIDNQVDIAKVSNALDKAILNQTQAVNIVRNRLEIAMCGFNDPERPSISMLFTGPTGVGKTEIAKTISEALNIPMKRFDMSMYPNQKDAEHFAEGLFQGAWSSPNGLLLIDEVEKSTKACMNILLQVLDDARLADAKNPNRVASFVGNIIILTTNLGSEIYQSINNFGDADQEIDLELVYQSLSASDVFETALLGRVDVTVPFNPLPDEAMTAIAERALRDDILVAETDKRHIYVSPDVLPYIIKDRTSRESERGGARDAKRNIKNLAIQPLATYLSGKPAELPIVMFVAGKPRFKHASVSDIKGGWIEVAECHAIETVDTMLGRLAMQVGKPLVNEGIYIPKTLELKSAMIEIVKLVKQGYDKIYTEMDGPETVFLGK